MRPIAPLLVVLAASASAQSVPKGVAYVRAKEAINDKAQAELKKMFARSPPVLKAKGTTLFVGPFLGIKLGKDGRAAEGGFTKLTAIIPLGTADEPWNAEMHSFAATTATQYVKLSSLLEKFAPRPPVRIRKLSGDEMKLIWPFISWDLVEPIFVVENDEQKWVVDFDETGLIPMWIEELSEPCFAPATTGECRCGKVTAKNGDYALTFEPRASCKEKPSAQGPSGAEPDPKLIRVELVKFLIADEKMGQRIAVEPLAAYFKKLIASGEAFARSQPGEPAAVTVTVVIKPGGEQRIWADAEAGSKFPAEQLRALERELTKLATPDPREVIVFQVLVQLWGGPPKGKDTFPSMPEVWRREVQRAGKQQDVEALVEKVW